VARYAFTTLGCKVNQYDSSALEAALDAAGLEPQASGAAEGPDLVVINTCCVTAAAMAKSRRAIRRAVRAAPGAAVLVTGCYADYDPSRLEALVGSAGARSARAVVAAGHDDLARRVRQLARRLRLAEDGPPHALGGRAGAGDCPCLGNDRWMSARKPLAFAAGSFGADIRTRRRAAVKRNCASAAEASGLPMLARFRGRQRAFVKVQDGCDAFCAYCVVPFARPIVGWRPIDRVLEECRRLLRAGHKELVLCGVFLGAYGHSTARRRRWGDEPSLLSELVRRVGELEGLWSLRLSSLEPGDLSEPLLAAFRQVPSAAWHFHLPLQSGSPRVLKRMNRQYSPDDFRRAVESIRAACPDAAITTDILVGFPGETEEDFRRTLELARYAGFSKIHAFPFSPIEGTAAWTYRTEAPPREIVRRRLAELAALEKELASAYRAQFVGRTMEALVERPACAASGRTHARPGEAMTDRYLTVFFSDAGPRPGEVSSFRVAGLHPDGLVGSLGGADRSEVRG
jgi:threonylcarbamoyladenosine tRNA methylthiotransferase MtaB